jgi:hypothetical protein
LVATRLAPHDQPHLRVRRIAERHRWSGMRFHILVGVRDAVGLVGIKR